jgi:hypothetical protein
MEWVVTGFEIVGVAVLAFGSFIALVSAAVTVRRGDPRGEHGGEPVGRRRNWNAAYKRARQDVGRAILLGLEILIIADIVLTITVERTLNSAVTLGLIVLVRTFLSFSLEIELDGALPWRRSPADRKPAGVTDLASLGDAAGKDPRAGP